MAFLDRYGDGIGETLGDLQSIWVKSMPPWVSKGLVRLMEEWHGTTSLGLLSF